MGMCNAGDAKTVGESFGFEGVVRLGLTVAIGMAAGIMCTVGWCNLTLAPHLTIWTTAMFGGWFLGACAAAFIAWAFVKERAGRIEYEREKLDLMQQKTDLDAAVRSRVTEKVQAWRGEVEDVLAIEHSQKIDPVDANVTLIPAHSTFVDAAKTRQDARIAARRAGIIPAA